MAGLFLAFAISRWLTPPVEQFPMLACRHFA
jgi:hypothetical protein